MQSSRIPRWVKWLMAGLVVYLAVCGAIGIYLADFAVHPIRTPLASNAWQEFQEEGTKRQAVLEATQIATRDGIMLKAWYVQPKKWNGKTVLLFHGISDNRAGVTSYGVFLMEHGFAFLAPDVRAHGESGGEVFSYGVNEAQDVREWGDWLWHKHKPQCLYGLGESMGAALVLQSLKYENRFCAVVAESAFSDFHAISYDRIGQWTNTGPWLGASILRPAVMAAWIRARWKYGIDFDLASPKLAVTGSHVPVLLIHGMSDSNIPPYHAGIIHAANPESTDVWLVSGAEHCEAWDKAGKEFERRVLAQFEVGKK
jgi:pimeloyl-ACP methyl ester carboxylesterase